MRTDPGLDAPDSGIALPGRHFRDGVSQSGRETNSLFLSREGTSFDDVSAISGADSPADGRAFGLVDVDRDGWLDLAVVNANAPLLQVFRNTLAARSDGRFVALRFVGGSSGADPDPAWSNRDGVGVRVEVVLGDAVLTREQRMGEGFAAQNGATMLVGLGPRDAADEIRVRWPSGRTQRLADVPAGSLTTLHERGDAEGRIFAREPYARETPAWLLATPEVEPEPPLLARLGARRPAMLRVLTTMATWCEACTDELPQIETLDAAFAPGQVELLGVPVDEDDDDAKLAAWLRSHRPAYELLLDLAPAERDAVRARVGRDLKRDALPASLVTDGRGRVVASLWGAPTVSELRALLERRGASAER